MANTLGKNSRHALPRKNRAPLAALLPALAMLCFSFGIAPGAQAATFPVTKIADTNDGACNADCSLREAVRAANASVGVADVINVPAGTYTLTIPGSTEDAAATGDLDITDTVTINGGGSANTIIQSGTNNANGIDKVFSVNQTATSNASATFNGVTVRFGRNTNPVDLVNFSHLGAGIDFFGTSGTLSSCGSEQLTITNSVITDNTVANTVSPGVGAGVSADNGDLVITNSTISKNKTTNQFGGGITHIGGGCQLIMTDSTVSNNEAHGGANGEGGGIFVRQNVNGTVEIHNSIISNNTSESRGGGIKLESTPGPLTATIDQQTVIFGNTSLGTGPGISEGGGVDISTLGAGSTTTLKDVTITGNHADDPADGGGRGGGIFLNLGTLNVSLSRITGNTAPMGSGLFGLRARPQPRTTGGAATVFRVPLAVTL
ncbi:MAG: CSLREA domain-containing protein [Gammaproteobacteria bacterium]|nr:CSLREA domain-containing protein [Gammaproteobacteria bacterium]